MHNRAALIALAFLPAFLSGAEPARPLPLLRAANAADLAGVWQMVGLNKDAKTEADDPLFAPYQIFLFDPNGGMKHMTSMKPFAQHNFALFDAAPLVIRYSLDKQGVLQLTSPAWDEPRKYQCNVVLTAGAPGNPKAPRPGDVVLSGVDDSGKITWSKLLRKAQ